MTVPDIDNSIVPLGSRILVTGASGFIGAHCCYEILKQGFNLRAAVRSNHKGQSLISSLPEKYHSRVEIVLIRDITHLESLTTAVKNCSGILHLASPYTYSVSNFEEELMKPAVKGTTTILEAAKTEPKVKRIVITSSFAAVFDATKGPQPGVILSEHDFSPLTYEDGISTKDVAMAYRSSKVVAERAAWDFIKQENPNFDIVILCPPMVYGPLLSTKLLDSIDSLNTSNQQIWGLATMGSNSEMPITKGPVWVDVRDLAFAHVQALQNPHASNQRFMISAGDFCLQEIADILREHLPEKLASNVVIGQPGKRISGTHYTTDSSKAINILGLKWTSLENSVVNLVLQLADFVNKET